VLRTAKWISGSIPLLLAANKISGDRIILYTTFHNHIVDYDATIHDVDDVGPVPTLDWML
jgi:hypothetical protein